MRRDEAREMQYSNGAVTQVGWMSAGRIAGRPDAGSCRISGPSELTAM